MKISGGRKGCNIRWARGMTQPRVRMLDCSSNCLKMTLQSIIRRIHPADIGAHDDGGFQGSSRRIKRMQATVSMRVWCSPPRLVNLAPAGVRLYTSMCRQIRRLSAGSPQTMRCAGGGEQDWAQVERAWCREDIPPLVLPICHVHKTALDVSTHIIRQHMRCETACYTHVHQ